MSVIILDHHYDYYYWYDAALPVLPDIAIRLGAAS